jgi:hypothetical protein
VIVFLIPSFIMSTNIAGHADLVFKNKKYLFASAVRSYGISMHGPTMLSIGMHASDGAFVTSSIIFCALKNIHAKVNDDFLKWLEKMFGDDKVAPVKSSSDKIQDYLAMKLDYSEEGKLKVNYDRLCQRYGRRFPQTS